jgi:hypothetical protein
VKLGVAGASMVASLPTLLIVGAHDIGKVTLPTPRKSPGSGAVADSTWPTARLLDNALKKKTRWQ